MCSGGGGAVYRAPEAPKVDPAPTVVQSADTGVDTSVGKKQKKRVGQSSNMLSNHGAELQSLLGDATNTTEKRTTLG